MAEHRLSYEQALARAARDTRTLGGQLLRRARKHPSKVAVTDFGGSLTRQRLVAAALALTPELELAPSERAVGILLPPGRGGAIANVALTLDGRTAVNLNHTAGNAQLARMCRMADLSTVVSSRTYLRRIARRGGEVELPRGTRVVLVEDVLARLRTRRGKLRVLAQILRLRVLPPDRIDKARTDDVAAILFSSGTTADPKGVQLTHRQLLANADGILEHMDLREEEGCVLTALPLFHSFGYGPGLWMALAMGLGVAGQADPFDGAALGELCAASGATILIATPTFARGYMRRVPAEQFRSLRFGLVSAERCPRELQDAFLKKYGAPLLEGFGCTELAPGVAINSERHHRYGSVGRPMSGVEVLIVDPETFEPCEGRCEGLIIVRSAARMRGYLGREDLTEQAFLLGGYNTGDIGHFDEDGYLYITGRQARFAKIGGEMVPLDHVEEALQAAVSEAGADEACEVAVAAVHDWRRGERLLVLHTGRLPAAPEDLIAALDELPALWRPKASAFHEVEELPMLGTGKRSLGEIQKMAEALDPSATRRVAAAAHDVAESAREGVERLVGGEDEGKGEGRPRGSA